jgi:CRISPR-associated protein Cmr6
MSTAPIGLPPMPKALATAARDALGSLALPGGANPGLVWERYPQVWSGSEIGNAKDRSEFLRRFVRDFNSSDSQKAGEPGLRELLTRMRSATGGGRAFRLTAPLCTGLGLEHPTENGCAFDPVLGLPMLPGSGLKGLARAAARALGEAPDLVEALLGSEPPSGPGAGDATTPGTVRFWGAWPDGWPKLRMELINPHHPKYQDDQTHRYVGDAHATPGDRQRSKVAAYTEEPIPVTFLALDADQDLVVFLDAVPGHQLDLERVWLWLAVGFEHLGAGGKTASGYGRAVPRGWSARVPAEAQPLIAEPTPIAAAVEAVVVAITGRIGATSPQLNDKELREGVAAELGLASADAVRVHHLAIVPPAANGGWERPLGDLAAHIGSAPGPVRGAFGFARIPALVAFGALLGDKGNGLTWDAPRGLKQGHWDPDAAALDFRREVGRGWTDATGVVLLVELSGAISKSQIPAGLRSLPMTTLSVANPAPGLIRSRAHLNAFRDAWRSVLDEIRKNFGLIPIHLLAAAPLSAAVECGRRLIAVDPPIHVYEAGEDSNRTFGYQLTVRAGTAMEEHTLKYTGPVDLLILIALVEEAVELRDLLGDPPVVKNPEGYVDFFLNRKGRSIVVRTVCDMGPAAAQKATTNALTRWKPKVAAWLGIAGSIDDDLKLCDVLVPDQVSHYDNTGKLLDNEGGLVMQVRPATFRTSQSLARKVSSLRLSHGKEYATWQKACAKDLSDEVTAAGGDAESFRAKHSRTQPNLYKHHLASGAFVMVSEAMKAQLKVGDASLKAVDMESAGLAWATFEDVPMVIVRGISDNGSPQKKELDAVGEGAFRRVAMRNASRLLLLAHDLGLLTP